MRWDEMRWDEGRNHLRCDDVPVRWAAEYTGQQILPSSFVVDKLIYFAATLCMRIGEEMKGDDKTIDLDKSIDRRVE